MLDIYSIVPSRNVPLGIGLLAQGRLYNIIVKDGRRNYNHNHMETSSENMSFFTFCVQEKSEKTQLSRLISCNKCFGTLHLLIIRSVALAFI